MREPAQHASAPRPDQREDREGARLVEHDGKPRSSRSRTQPSGVRAEHEVRARACARCQTSPRRRSGAPGPANLELREVREVGDAHGSSRSASPGKLDRRRASRRAPRSARRRRAGGAPWTTSRAGGSRARRVARSGLRKSRCAHAGLPVWVGRCAAAARARRELSGPYAWRSMCGRLAHDRSRSPSGSKNGFVVTSACSIVPSILMSSVAAVLARARAGRPPSRRPCSSCSLKRTLVTRPAERPSCTTWPPSSGTRPLRHLEADEHRLEPALLHVLDRPLADEVVLVELDDPGHRRLERVRLGVGVLADEDVHLLEAQDALGLEPERRRRSTPCRARAARPRRARRAGSGSGSRSRARRRSRCAGSGRARRRRERAWRRDRRWPRSRRRRRTPAPSAGARPGRPR